MAIKYLYSEKIDTKEAAQEIKEAASGFDAKLVVSFASSKHDIKTLSQMLKDSFSTADVFGCSTAGEICSNKMLKNSVVVMLFDSETVSDVCVQVVPNIKTENNLPSAFKAFEEHYNAPSREWDFDQYVGMVLFDGLAGAEERMMEKIGDLSDIIFVGGSAGDDLQFVATSTFVNGNVYDNAAILALLKLNSSFDIIKTQSFRPLDKVLKATKVDIASRTVHEFNGKPAVVAYAEALGVAPEQIPEYFLSNPIGLMVEGEPFVRSPRQVMGDSLSFFCNIKEGMELNLLQSTDIVEETKKALKKKLDEIGPVIGLLNFHCIKRTVELEQKGQQEAYAAIFKDVPTIGFSTYGEAYLGHINQTSTMLVLK